jgi:hypothetical protein
VLANGNLPLIGTCGRVDNFPAGVHDLPMAIRLEVVDRRNVFLNDGTYRWINIKRFRQDPPGLPRKQDILPVLIAHPSYRDDYASPTGETEAPIHGRYRLDAISPDVFDEVASSHASEVLNTWMDQFGPLDRDGVVGDLDEVFELLRRSPLVLQLRNLGKDAQHDWGWVVGGAGFHEFVAVESEGEIAVIVAGDD